MVTYIPSKYDEFIRRSYFGGIVDVYNPTLKDGFYYDIHSLYPAAMFKPMPIGSPIIHYNLKSLDNLFGFVEVEITAPTGMKIPFLPYHSINGLIVPVGTWTGVYYYYYYYYLSDELKYAVKLGYKVRIIGMAYEFKQGNPFTSYVNTLVLKQI